ncbi:hypothetical protein LTR95_000457 [Oleoguttula sp. CCFEE 5521]
MKCTYCQLIPASIVLPPAAPTLDPETGKYLLHQYRYGREDVLPRLPALAASSASGCDMCQLLKRQIEIALPEWIKNCGLNQTLDGQISPCCIDTFVLFHEDGVPAESHIPVQNAPYELSFQVSIPGINDVGIGVPFHIRAGEGSLAATHGNIRRRPISKEPLCPENMRMVQDFINQCLHDHVECQVRQEERFVPTRLLHLSDASKKHVSLVHTKGMKQPPTYAALSYMWGKYTDLTITTKESLHEPNLYLSSLPATFQDAAQVCRALGVQYLWIDALCIVQNDAQDWDRESSQMNLIYAHAYFTIAATRSHSARDGFLQLRCNEEARFDYPSTSPETLMKEFVVVGDDSPRMYNDLYANVELSPWNSRGWTMQERVLSRRVLHFTETMLFLECRTTDWVEDERSMSSSGVRVGRLMTHNSHCAVMSRSELLNSWYSIVRLYNHRAFTYSRDKFSAISGVAHEIGMPLDDTYVAGLWLTDLENGLLWWSSPEPAAKASATGIAKLSSEWVAPGWSWASRKSRISLYHDPTQSPSQFTVTAVDVVPDTTDPMGRLRSASLTILGKLCATETFQRHPEDSETFNVSIDGTLYLGEGHIDDSERMPRGRIYALLIRITRFSRIACLLLEDANDQPGSFRRVGTLDLLGHAAKVGNRMHLFETLELQRVRLV